MQTRLRLAWMAAVVSISAALTVAAPARAQGPPSLAGEWIRLDSAARPTTAAAGDAAFRIGDMGSGWGSPVTIMQSPESLVVAFQHFAAYDLQPKVRYVFALNGSETTNHVMIGHAESMPRSIVRWEGATLIVTSRYPTPPEVSSAPTEVRQTLALDAQGRLVVETVRPGARAPDVVRSVYTRR